MDGRPKIYPKSENIQILLPLMASQMLLKGIWCISQKSLSGAHLSSSMINGQWIKNVRNHIYPISIQQPYSIAPQSQMESLIQRIAFVMCGPHSAGPLIRYMIYLKWCGLIFLIISQLFNADGSRHNGDQTTDNLFSIAIL